MTILPGTVVLYHPRVGEEPAPALVLKQWPDDSVQLHVFHFDSGTHIRSAVSTDFDIVMNPIDFGALLDDYQTLNKRIEDLERMFEVMHDSITVYNSRSQPPLQVDASTLDEDLLAPLPLRGTETWIDESAPEVHVDSTSPATDESEAPDLPNPWKKRKRA